ncbi:MAG TPA: c-type cytochrome [Steroidobacteraceae bacterium]|nr:c-type cytochrome [Steroidobacteraceae bacterium]HUA23909.1 c-type cytochrome [Steroidobacteraceae bacterium]
MRAHVPAALCVLSMLVAAAAHADEPISYQQAMRLVHKYHCQQCHAQEQTLKGPSFQAIADRYRSDPHAQSELASNILNGTVGAWGPVPMPPVKVREQDLRALLNWILTLPAH